MVSRMGWLVFRCTYFINVVACCRNFALSVHVFSGLFKPIHACMQIQILTATSTLAAGVNMPARRVIFNSINIGRNDIFLDGNRYKQMAGLAIS